jgi:hypothetical protein
MQFGFDFEVVGAVAIWVRDVRGVGAARVNKFSVFYRNSTDLVWLNLKITELLFINSKK